MFICGIEDNDLIVYECIINNDKFTLADVQRHLQYIQKGGTDIWASGIQLVEIFIYTQENNDKAQAMRQSIMTFINDDAVNDRESLLLLINEYLQSQPGYLSPSHY